MNYTYRLLHGMLVGVETVDESGKGRELLAVPIEGDCTLLGVGEGEGEGEGDGRFIIGVLYYSYYL